MLQEMCSNVYFNAIAPIVSRVGFSQFFLIEAADVKWKVHRKYFGSQKVSFPKLIMASLEYY